ncbi:MAG: hypothetical protein ACK5UC_18545 [Planctomycetaceae bacterium]
MWCSHCQSEVRPVISLAGNPPRCSLCGFEFTGATAPGRTGGEATSQPTPPESQRPRLSPQDLLARWARDETLPPFELGSGQSAAPPLAGPLPPAPHAPAVARGPAVARLDASHPSGPQPVTLPEQIAAAPPTARVAAPHFSLGPTSSERPVPSSMTGPTGHEAPVHPAPPASRPTRPADRDDEAGPVEFSEVPARHWHGSHAAVRPPHFPWEPVPLPRRASRSWQAAAQIFVLVGVVGLATGTLVLIYTHFWAPETDSLLPLGYVIAACSQLVLLLGVVQHISLGLEQAEQTMTWRVARLGERLERVEAAAGRGTGEDHHSPE